MNLPPPFNKAKGVKTNPDGSISLIDARGKALARIPMATAFELSTGSYGYGVGYGDGHGVNANAYGQGSCCGDGHVKDSGSSGHP
jgi:hypothetical protein